MIIGYTIIGYFSIGIIGAIAYFLLDIWEKITSINMLK